jgi:hypothetical protein
VVEVAVDGLGCAAGRVAGGGAGADQVSELAAGGVAGLGSGVLAATLGDRREGDVRALEELRELGCLAGRGFSLAGRRLALPFSGCPRVLSD